MTHDAGDSLPLRLSPLLAKLLAFVWATAVVAICVMQYDVCTRLIVFSELFTAALPAISIGKYFGQFWLQRLADFAWCLGILFTAFGVGSVITARWTRQYNLLTGLFALAAGLWMIAAIVLAIGVASVPKISWVFILASAWLLPAPRKFVHRYVWVKTDVWTKVLLGFLLVAIALNFLGATTPPFEYDALEYHLGGPAEYIKAGRIIFLPHNFYTNLPQLTEMLYLVGLVTRSPIAPKMLHMCFGMLSALAIYAVGERLWSRRIGVTAAALFYCLPFVFDLSATARIDLATTFFATLAFGGMLLAYDGDRWVWLAGLAVGAAVATKWTAIAVVFLPALVYLLVTRKSFFMAGVFCLMAGLCILPWLIKNAFLTGNPVYPMLYTIFPNPHWSASQAALFASKHYAKFADGKWQEFGELVWRYSFVEPGASPVLLMTAPLVLLVRNKPLRRAVCLFLAAYAGWYFLTFRPWRFLMPALPLAAVLGACALDSAGKWSRPFVVAVLLFGLTSIGLNFLIDSESEEQMPPRVGIMNLVLGQISEHDFLARMGHHVFEPIVWMNDHLPASARVLYIGEARTFWAHNDVVAATAFDQSPFSSLDSLRSRGFTHVYINSSELRRLQANYGYLSNFNENDISSLVTAGKALPSRDLLHTLSSFPPAPWHNDIWELK